MTMNKAWRCTERNRNPATGHMDIGITAAILLVLGGWMIADQMGWWDAWPWWGKALFVLGAIAVFVLGSAFEQSRRRPGPS